MKNFSINPLFFIVVAIAYTSGNIFGFSIIFMSLVMHELIHLFFLSKKHAIIKKICIEPFGISILTENPREISPVVFISAPVFNIIISFVFYFFAQRFYKEAFFFISEANLSLGIFNLLPFIPFDGGRFIEAICEKKGTNCHKFMIFTSVSAGIILTILGIMFLKITQYNFSICLIGIFLVFNAFCENENFKLKKSKTIIRKSTPIIKKTPTKIISVPYNYPAHKLISEFLTDEFYIVNIIKNGRIINTVTENQIIEKVVNSDSNLPICEIY